MVEIISHPSPNFGPRRHGGDPDMVVLHYTAMDNCEAALARLCDPEHEVSAHYVIAEDGRVFHLVNEAMRAWHAGAGQWGAVTDVNSHSVGIELANKGPLAALPPYPEPQMAALDRLLAGVLARWSIAPARVIGHSDMALDRKVDPGPKFDWQRLARQGLAVWPDLSGFEETPDENRFLHAARDFGYDETQGLGAVLAGFRLRFLPGKTGALSSEDMGVVQKIARRFPVDPVSGAD